MPAVLPAGVLLSIPASEEIPTSIEVIIGNDVRIVDAFTGLFRSDRNLKVGDIEVLKAPTMLRSERGALVEIRPGPFAREGMTVPDSAALEAPPDDGEAPD